MVKKKKQYLVIGLGRFGSSVAVALFNMGAEVLAVDIDADAVEAHRNQLTDVVQADAMDRRALKQIGAGTFDVAIVTIGADIKSGGTITMLLKEMGVPCVIAKAYDGFYGRMLMKLGADKVIFPERDMGVRIAHNLVSGNILDFIELSPDYSMMEIRPKPEWEGHSLGELNLRATEQINVVAVRRGEQVNAMPDAQTRVDAGDLMLVVTASGGDAGPAKR